MKHEMCSGCVYGMVCSCSTVSLLSNFLKALEAIPPSVGEDRVKRYWLPASLFLYSLKISGDIFARGLDRLVSPRVPDWKDRGYFS